MGRLGDRATRSFLHSLNVTLYLKTPLFDTGEDFVIDEIERFLFIFAANCH
jgi:hypothetical protein